MRGENKIIFVENGELTKSKINIADFNYSNISNNNLVVSDKYSNEEILKSVLNGTGQKSHNYVVALNTALVLWVAGIENNIENGFKKALFSMSKAKPWDKFLLLKAYLET